MSSVVSEYPSTCSGCSSMDAIEFSTFFISSEISVILCSQFLMTISTCPIFSSTVKILDCICSIVCSSRRLPQVGQTSELLSSSSCRFRSARASSCCVLMVCTCWSLDCNFILVFSSSFFLLKSNSDFLFDSSDIFKSIDDMTFSISAIEFMSCSRFSDIPSLSSAIRSDFFVSYSDFLTRSSDTSLDVSEMSN